MRPVKFVVLGIFTVFITSCVSYEQQVLYTPPSPNFAPSSYINPERYGYNLNMHENKAEAAVDSSFIPLSYKGDPESRQILLNYPRKALLKNMEGKVILQVYVDSTGILQNIDVIQSPGRPLTVSSIKALLFVEFNPATLNGKPVNSFARVPFVFRMRE